MLCSDEKAKKNKNARPPQKRNGIIVCTKYYVLEKRERKNTPIKMYAGYCSYIENSYSGRGTSWKERQRTDSGSLRSNWKRTLTTLRRLTSRQSGPSVEDLVDETFW